MGPLDQLSLQLIAVGALELLAVPLIVWLTKRFIGKKLDSFDEKREDARKEREQRIKHDDAWRECMTSGMRSMLRSEIIGEFRKARDKGYANLETKEYVERVYLSYKELNGNGLGKSMYEEIMAMPSEPPSEHKHEHHEEF